MPAHAASLHLRKEPLPFRIGPSRLDLDVNNDVVAQLPPETQAFLRTAADLVELRQGDLLQVPGRPIDHVYFPIGAVVSFLSESDGGRVVEVASVGCEGFTGVSLMLGAVHASTAASVQLPGSALRLSAAAFRRLTDSHDPLYHACLRSVDAFLVHVLHISACNARHQLSQRCARWLLVAHDRLGSTPIPVTQAYLAMLLGARRAGVTTTLIDFQRAGLVKHARGRITVLQREQLERLSCRCAAPAPGRVAERWL